MIKQISLNDIQDGDMFTAARIRQTVCQARNLVRANWITAKELWKRIYRTLQA